MAERPTGTVTFLFTDVEGSTQAWERTPTEMDQALELHDQVLRAAIEANGGYVFATGGDSFSAAFSSPTSALIASVEAQRGFVSSECGLRVRMGVHSGEAIERDGNYFGPPLNQTARLMSIGHGGQVLVSDITKGLVTAAGFEFLDLGEHRLADLSTPVRIAQLIADGLNAEFPPLPSAVTTDNLPRLGEVFGRSTDIDRIKDLLTDHRLVTLTGAGGIGKTTLATSVAVQMTEPFPDGRWLVDLTDLASGSDRAAVAGGVAGVDDRFGSVEALAPRRMLLILDNCEHVLDGATSYLTDLLATASDVTVLATSREPLGVRGEKVVPVAPLSVDEDSDHASAIDLFIDRAYQAEATLDLNADHNTIVAICGAVGGLPLAIELAAARTAVMTPSQILDRLSDRLAFLRGGTGGPEHHRTIEATIAWSYDLLDPDTQKLLRFLSVFEGGLDLDQAEAVGGSDAVDRLTDLVRKSLVHRDGVRFGMLEAVRQYATARLQEADEEDEARRRHFEYFANWAHNVYHRADFIRLDPEERGWCSANFEGLHSCVRWGAEHAASIAAAQIAVILWGHYIEALYGRPTADWFEPLLDHLDEFDPQLQMGVLHGSGAINAWHLDDIATAEARHLAEYDIYERTGLTTRTGANPHGSLGIVANVKGEWEEAIRWYKAGIRELGDEPKTHLVGNLARALCDVRGDAEAALERLLDARRYLQYTNPWQRSAHATIEAEMYFRIGDLHTARSLLTSILSELRQPGLRSDLYVGALMHLAKIEQAEGNPSIAAILYLEVMDIEEAEDYQERFWQTWESIYLSRLLQDLNEPSLSARALAEYRSSSPLIEPARKRELEIAEERLGQAIHGHTGQGDNQDQPFAEALRRALGKRAGGRQPEPLPNE